MPHTIVRFGDFELDTARYQVRRAGRLLKLERIPMELLALLVEKNGELVSREAIVERLWGKDVFLETEHSINTAINKIRRALRDDPRNPQYIQTVSGKGYRFLAETRASLETAASAPLTEPQASGLPGPRSPAKVTGIQGSPPEGGSSAEADSSAAETALAPGMLERSQVRTLSAQAAETPKDLSSPPIPTPKRPPLFWAAAGLLVAAATLYALMRNWHTTAWTAAGRDIHSIAVLPLANLSKDPEQEYLVDGLTDQLITDLARTTPLRVISRTSAMQYKQAHKPLPEIARELNVDAIVEGSVLPRQGNVRITAQLLDARNDQHLWAQSYERSANDLLAIQDEVANDIAQQIATTLQPVSRSPHERAANPEAYDKYLRGRFFWNRRTLADLQKAIGYYQQAIDLDPNFAPAYAALGDAYAVITFRGGPPPIETYPRAREAAEKALQLDSTLADAHALLGEVKVNYDFDWEGGEREFQRAIELNPNYPTAHHWYALLLALQKKPREAQIEIEKGFALDPLSMAIYTTRAELRNWQRQPDQALALLRQAQDLDPSFVDLYAAFGAAYEQKKLYAEARQSYERATDLSSGNPKMLMMQAHAYALTGEKDSASALIRRVRVGRQGYLADSDVAAVYCAMGENAIAMDLLNNGFKDHDEGLTTLAVEPLFDGCRRDPRFERLLRRLRLPE
jgi:TolB-like protein/DNA-binding winged helix-turn-helix (wHTH) protein/Flp pilus assembly protein TadD